MNNWNNTSYQKISKAIFSEGIITIQFENSDIAKIPINVLTPNGFTDINWDNLYFNQFELIIPAKPKNIEIPWDNLRVLTDKEFAKYLAEKSEEQSKLIGIKIKRLREKKDINSKELAERANLSPQTISRIEQGHTDVSFITLRKILAAMGYSLKDLANQEIALEQENNPKTLNTLIKKLGYVGIDSNLLIKKIIPTNLQAAILSQKNQESSLLLDEATSYISTVFGWSNKDIWHNQNLHITPEPAEMAFFKKPSNANENQVKAYSHYAFYLAKVVLKSFGNKTAKTYPASIEEFKSTFYKEFDELNFNSLLNFVWNMGICVLPLNDSGVFHGASWNIEGKHVIVLKQNTQSHARWIFDLLHELYHVFAHLDELNTSVVETVELNPFTNNDSIEELEANSFANQVVFGMRAETLAEECVSFAKWDIKNLTKAVKHISKKENVREDFLANYMAFRLSFQGENWWSSAMKMQISEPNPFTIATDILKSKIQMNKLNPIDYNLLNTAITN